MFKLVFNMYDIYIYTQVVEILGGNLFLAFSGKHFYWN